MKFLKQIDGLRAIAIIGVMISHWVQGSIQIDVLKNIPFGTGVDLFFVISGFLITSIILDFKEKNISENKSQFTSIKSFYIRRSLRIFPIYYLTIIFLLIIGFANTSELFPWLATYTTNVYMTLNSKYIGEFTPFWSLAVEEQFYIIWIFVIVFVSSKKIKSTILVLCFISILILYYMKFNTTYWLSNSLVICQMHTLGLGALIAYFRKYKKEFFENLNLSVIKTITLFLTLIFIILFVYRQPYELYNNVKYFEDPAISIIYFFLVLIAAKDGFTGIIKNLLENKFMLYIGKISYGLYVYHAFIGTLMFYIIDKYFKLEMSLFAYFLTLFISNIVLSSISWYLIEKPINSLKKHFKY